MKMYSDLSSASAYPRVYTQTCHQVPHTCLPSKYIHEIQECLSAELSAYVPATPSSQLGAATTRALSAQGFQTKRVPSGTSKCTLGYPLGTHKGTTRALSKRWQAASTRRLRCPLRG
eukprot:841882-Pleurochrysis_carterae.AAC.2